MFVFVFVVVRVLICIMVIMLVMVMILVLVLALFMVMRGKQRAVQLNLLQLAVGGGRQGEQAIGLLQRCLDAGNGRAVFVCAGLVLKANQVGGRAIQLQADLTAVDHQIQAGNAMLMGIQAAVLVVVVVIGEQGLAERQGKAEGEQGAAHDKTPAEIRKCYLISFLLYGNPVFTTSAAAPLAGRYIKEVLISRASGTACGGTAL